MGSLFGNGTTGILFSLFVIGILLENLVLDFDFIEEGAERDSLNIWNGMVHLG